MPNEPTTDELIKDYREARARLLERVDQLFPARTRVKAIGGRNGKWGATVRALEQVDRVRISADMVWLDWDNGNKFATSIDEIELEAASCG